MQEIMPQLIEPEPFTWVRYPLHRKTKFGGVLLGLGRVAPARSEVSAAEGVVREAPLGPSAPDAALEALDPALLGEARGKVFTQELRSVTDRVLAHSGSPRAPAPAEPVTEMPESGAGAPAAPVADHEPSSELQALRWMRPPLAPHPDAVMRWLHTVYSGRVSVTSGSQPLTEFLLTGAGAGSFALLLPESDEFLYRVALQDGLDSTTASNLTFALNDEYLKKAQPDGILRFRDFDEDFFFKKRLSTVFFRTHELLLMLDLQAFGETGYLCFFYEQATQCDASGVREHFQPFLSDLAPALRKRRVRAESGTNLTRRVFQLMRRLTDGGKHPLSVLHMRVADMPQDVSGRHALRDAGEQIRSIISPAERIVLLPPDRMIVLMYQTDEQLVIDRLHQTAAQSGYRVAVSMRRYPDSGRNLLNYARMP